MFVCMRVSWGHLDVWGELASHKGFARCVWKPGL